jgi:hypothetical protein
MAFLPAHPARFANPRKAFTERACVADTCGRRLWQLALQKFPLVIAG